MREGVGLTWQVKEGRPEGVTHAGGDKPREDGLQQKQLHGKDE